MLFYSLKSFYRLFVLITAFNAVLLALALQVHSIRYANHPLFPLLFYYVYDNMHSNDNRQTKYKSNNLHV